MNNNLNEIKPGRYTAQFDDPLVVFTIGMRLNKILALHKWIVPMLNTFQMWLYLKRHPPEGYLSGYLYFYWRGIGMMQYWKDFSSLESFSHDHDQPHFKAWTQLAKQTKTDRSFGYWHETYEISPETSETVYGNMPRFGLADATNYEQVSDLTESARDRLKSTHLS